MKSIGTGERNMGNQRWMRRMCSNGLKLFKREALKENLQVFTLEETKPDQKYNPLPAREIKTRSYGGIGWRISYDNPEGIIEGFFKLYIKTEYRLAAYQYQEVDNGNGIVWAIPIHNSLPEPDECSRLNNQFLSPPKPSFACDEFMEAIDGDHTPLSYLQAAIAYHKLKEFGAMWHGINWGEDRLLTSLDSSEWDWVIGEIIPKLIRPHFYYDKKGRPVIVFHTINPIGTLTLNRYEHTFESHGYRLTCKKTVLATDQDGGGLIF